MNNISNGMSDHVRGNNRPSRKNNNNHRRQQKPSNNRRNNNGGGSNISSSNAHNARNKYLDKAKEAMSYGDRVMAENFFQHADHYARIIIENEGRNAISEYDRNRSNSPEAPVAPVISTAEPQQQVATE